MPLERLADHLAAKPEVELPDELRERLLDQFLEFRMGQLKQFDRLLQLGRHDELLVQLHLHFHLQRHVSSFLVKVRIQKFMNGFS